MYFFMLSLTELNVLGRQSSAKLSFSRSPEPPVLPWYRRIPQAYLWWAGSVVFLGLTVIWLPSQCVLDDLGIPARGNAEEAGFPKLDQDKELEFRKDELWYKLNDENLSLVLLRPIMRTVRFVPVLRSKMEWHMA